MSEWANGAEGVAGNELCGKRPPNADNASRTRNAAEAAHQHQDPWSKTVQHCAHLQKEFEYAL